MNVSIVIVALHPENYHASPADTDTAQDLIWRGKGFTLKEKGLTRPYDVRGNSTILGCVQTSKRLNVFVFATANAPLAKR